MLGLCPDDPNKCQKLLDEMQNLIDAQRVKASDPKGLAQRYRRLGRGSLPADVRDGYIKQFKNRQKQLRGKGAGVAQCAGDDFRGRLREPGEVCPV
jgi:hypothetical protein